MDDNQCKTSKKFVFPTNTCSVHSCPWPNHRSPKMPKPRDLLMESHTLLTFPIFPSLAKPHPEFMEVPPRRTAACHICSRLLAESVHKDTKLYSSRNRALSFSKSNCQRAHTHGQSKLQHTLQNWSLETKPKQTWGTHTNRSRRSSLSCDPLRPAITLQIRSYSRGIVLCQRTPSPSIPPIPAAPCNNKPPCSHVTA